MIASPDDALLATPQVAPKPLPQASSRDSPARREALQDAQVFVRLLLQLRGELPTKTRDGEETRKDTARLAGLRRSAGELLPGRGTAWFVQMLFEGAPREKNPRLAQPEIYFLVATLFDLNRFKTVRGDHDFGDLGRSLRLMVQGGSEEKAVERRFKILLDSEFDRITNEFSSSGWPCLGGGEMSYRLRQTVKMLAGQKIGVDWARLIVDLSRWNSEGKSSQKRWARSFYDAPREVSEALMDPQDGSSEPNSTQ